MTYEEAVAILVPLSIGGVPILPKRSKYGRYKWMRYYKGSFDEIGDALGWDIVKISYVICSNMSVLTMHEDNMEALLERYSKHMQRISN